MPGHTAQGGHALPFAVRLARCEIDELVEGRLRWLLARLHDDPWLSAVAACIARLVIAFDLHLRFAECKGYTRALYKG